MGGLRGCLLNQCGGHIGAALESLNFMWNRCKSNPDITTQTLINQFFSMDLSAHFLRIWGDMQDEALKRLSSEQKMALRSTLISNELLPADVHDLLVRLFVIADDENKPGPLKFISPLCKRRLVVGVFPGRAESNPASLLDLVISAVRCMHQLELEQATERGTRTLPKETALQHMFYDGLCRSVAPGNEVVSEMSALLENDGEVDFYVGRGMKWAIELLCAGDRLQEHQVRFSHQRTSYTPEVSAYALVDFWPHNRFPKNLDRKRIVVQFSQQFDQAQIFVGSNQPLEIISLR
eukprot:c17927_g2_i1.p1 GENE.c17927_g2_i1~~c17927_g2_i1.p1  ORF type:complete len:293 (+),score=43.01 c17927_g2_i1:1-879(+)